jgi:hypothetical protein
MRAQDGDRLLTAALGFRRVSPRTAAGTGLTRWLDSWPGVRAIAAVMRAQHQALTVEKRPGDGWTAVFRYVGPTQLPKAAPSGLATAETPWQAVQWAAWMVLRRAL